jgi:hypothetical protein
VKNVKIFFVMSVKPNLNVTPAKISLQTMMVLPPVNVKTGSILILFLVLVNLVVINV